MIQNPNGTSLSSEKVSYLVVEEGNWTMPSGTAIEAHSFYSTLVGDNNNWVGEAQNYSNNYTTPLVFASIMSYNDSRFQIANSWGSSRTNPPGASLVISRNVAEDPDASRNDETVGYIVVEQANGNLSDIMFESALGTDTVAGVGDSPPYYYEFNTPFDTTPEFALNSLAGLDGGNGGWSQLYSQYPLNSTHINIIVDEDQIADSERAHTNEQVSYFVFEETGSYPEISNSLPSKVLQSSPANETSDTVLQPIFSWYNASDADGDNLTYELQVDDYPDFSSSLEVNATSIIEGSNLTNYTIAVNLTPDSQYYWRVRAYDGTGYGNWSDAWEYYAEGIISFRFISQNISLGSLELGQENDTTDDIPMPLMIENDGNVIIDITLNASSALWFSQPLGTSYFMFLADDRNESGSFNMTGSQTSWMNVSLQDILAVSQLKSVNTNDTAVIDIYMKVPFDEPAGTKSADLNFRASRS